MPLKTDEALVEAARRGEAGAIERLLAQAQPDVRRFARRSCATREDAEEAVQLALWQLYRRVGMLRSAAALAAWLFRIVERECYRLFGRHRPAVPLDELPDELEPLAHATPHELRLDLARAIQTLTPPYREVLILRDVHELTAPEVAHELGISVEAVKSRLQRARQAMRTALLASGYWRGDAPP